MPTGPGACFAQGLDEALAIRVVLEDGFAPVAAIQDVEIAPGFSTLNLRAMPGDWRLPRYTSISRTDRQAVGALVRLGLPCIQMHPV
jgi:hypothetical protein